MPLLKRKLGQKAVRHWSDNPKDKVVVKSQNLHIFTCAAEARQESPVIHAKDKSTGGIRGHGLVRLRPENKEDTREPSAVTL